MVDKKIMPGETIIDLSTNRGRLYSRINNIIKSNPANKIITIKLVVQKRELVSWILKDIEKTEG